MALSINARTFVVCVGVSNYQNSANNLAQTTKDAKAFKSVMENHTKDITILTSRYANKTNILEKLRAVCNRAQKGDHVLFFLVGMAIPEESSLTMIASHIRKSMMYWHSHPHRQKYVLSMPVMLVA